MKVYTYYLNSFETFTIIKSNKKTNKFILYIYISNIKNFLRIPVHNEVHIDSFSKTLNVYSKNILINDFLVKNANFKLNELFCTYFFKVKFVGKGFRLQSFKNKKIINFTFGYSHKMYMRFPLFFFKRINKYKYFFKGKNLFLINLLKNRLKTIKPINPYTLRGLRLTRTIIVKRKGRKSPTL